MKNIAALLCAAAVCVSCASAPEASRSSASKNEENAYSAPTGLANPVRPSSSDEIKEELGFPFSLPDGASDAVYSIINDPNAEPTAQIAFIWNGFDCVLRIRASSELEDISGFYYPWTVEEQTRIGWCGAAVRCAESNGRRLGTCAWYDAAPGLLYNVAMKNGADAETLIALAQECYAPAQSESE